jgi:hypothetical protein
VESAVKAALHHSPITSLVLSRDNQYLFAAVEDSCIYMMKIIWGEPRRSNTARTS